MQKSYATKQSYYFRAHPDKVFAGLTDPKLLTRWFLSRAKVDRRRSGKYSFDWFGGYHMDGKVKKYDRNDRLVSYSWHDKLPSGKFVETTANFRVAKKGRGTILRLNHTGFKDPEHFADCSSRWGYYLTNMKSVLDHGSDLRSKYDW